MMKRRNRSDFQSRDYCCPCGKAYLSYPALHTHIKKYHPAQENMLEHAVKPESRSQARGRPKNKQQFKASDELEELTMYQISILKIYDILTPLYKTGILLQGDQQIDEKDVQKEYQQVFHHQNQKHQLSLTQMDSKTYENLVQKLVKNLTKHFSLQISARLKFVVIQGYIQSFVNHSGKQQCLAKMGRYFWNDEGMMVASVIYDVLMRGLQRHGHSLEVLSSSEE